jgi:hypothetical protein
MREPVRVGASNHKYPERVIKPIEPVAAYLCPNSVAVPRQPVQNHNVSVPDVITWIVPDRETQGPEL